MHAAKIAWLLVSALTMWGCASGGRADPQSVTGGVSLEMRIRDTGGMHAMYLVKQDGTITFAGGLDATWDRPTWTGAMTREQIDRFTSLIGELGWFERTPPSTADPPGRSYSIALRGPTGKRSYKVKGAGPQVAPMHALLQEIAGARLDLFIERQPKPGDRIDTR